MTRGCVIKQIADVGNWGSVLLRKSGRQGRPCLSVIPTKEEGSWGIYPPTPVRLICLDLGSCKVLFRE